MFDFLIGPLIVAAMMCVGSVCDARQPPEEPKGPEAPEALPVDPPPDARTEIGPTFEPRAFSIEARPVAWLPTVSGDSRFGAEGFGREFQVHTAIGLDDNEPTFSGDFTLTFGRWSVWCDAFEFDAQESGRLSQPIFADGTLFDAGDPFSTRWAATSFGAHVGYDLFGDILHPEGPLRAEVAVPAELRLHLLAGARMLNVRHRLTFPGEAEFDFDQWTGTVDLGLKLSLALLREFGKAGRWDLSIAMIGGYGGLGDVDLFTFDLWFGINYTIVDSLAIAVGYRQIDIDLEFSGRPIHYEFDGRISGLFFGASVNF